MPRNATIVQVFVASPSDVQQERDILETLIDELNQTWSNSLGLVFELLRWETHVRPSFGSDPQDVINVQIGEDYDVFIGILWGRFGSATPRAASGTIEEFDRALARFRGGSGGPEIMIYFKDAPLSPSKLDPAQLAQLQSFRASLGDRGGLYAVFEDEAGFQSSLRAHLSRLAQKFASPASQSATSAVSRTIENKVDDSQDDLGYLDYVELYDSRMTEFTSALNVISGATTRIGEQMTQRTAEILNLGAPGLDVKMARRHVKKVADDMDAYTDILSSQMPIMSSTRVSAFHALTQALTLYNEFSKVDQADLQSLSARLTMMREAARSATTGLVGFRSSVRTLPRMTGELNKARKRVVSNLDSMILEVESTINTIENIRKSVDTMIGVSNEPSPTSCDSS
jgi:hypothetical protein